MEIISVSQYLDKINNTLKSERAKIKGEASGIKMYDGRSYLYFSIKDSADQSTVNCFMWKRDFVVSGVNLEEGMEIIVTAYPSIYKPNGGLSLQVELVELVGEGQLKIAYDKLKKELETEGLLSDSRKREIPDYPHRIGVITSRNGAVINDFLSNIGKFGYEILFVDSRVEGQDATKDLLSAVKTLEDKNLDVLVIMRGGGSLESFMAFNNETLVRAVANFPAPVLTGIGHDKDAPLVSLVSDKNVSTPTAVTTILNSTWGDALSSVRLSEEKIFSKFQSSIKDCQFFIENSQISIEKRFTVLFDAFKKAEETLLYSISRIDSEIRHISETISNNTKDIIRWFNINISNATEILNQSSKTLELSNPKRQLSRGYSIVKSEGKVVRYVHNVKSGDDLEIMVSDGVIKSKTV